MGDMAIRGEEGDTGVVVKGGGRDEGRRENGVIRR